jgi:hypothetical protein
VSGSFGKLAVKVRLKYAPSGWPTRFRERNTFAQPALPSFLWQ